MVGSWLAVGLVSIAVYRNLTIDDAFISWRHGFNLVERGVYQANPTGEAVEAATSALYGLLAAIPAMLGIDVVLFFKLVSLCLLLALAAFSSTRLGDRAEGWLLVMMLVGGPVQAVHLWSGLETPVFVGLLTLISLRLFGTVGLADRTVGGLLALLVVTRPEGVAVAAGVVVSLAVLESDGSRGSWRGLIAGRRSLWLPPLSVAAASIALRMVLFGRLLPNSAATKVEGAGGLLSRLETTYLNIASWMWVPATIAVVAVTMRSRSARTRFLAVALLVFLPTLGVYALSNLQMNFAQRFSFQIAWPLVAAGVMASGAGRTAKWALGALVTGLMTLSMNPSEHRYLIDYYPRATDSHTALGEVLSRHEPGVLVLGDAGMAPFASGWELIDPYFLVTPSELGMEGIVDTVRSTDERMVVVLQSETPDPAGVWAGLEPVATAAADSGAMFVGASMWREDYWLLIWVGRGAADDESLVSDIRAAVADSERSNSTSRIRDSILGNHWSR